MPSDKPSGEPSMEEILASIRRIISEESSEPAADSADVLELTDVVDEAPADEPVAETPAMAEAVPEPEATPEAPVPVAPAMEPEAMETERLVSGLTAAAAGSRFSALARAAEPDPLQGMRGGRTVEEIAVDLLRPMLKEWLDANLPTVVERMVEREIRYLSRRPENE